MSIDTYILDDQGYPVPEPDTIKWGRWLENADRIVAKDQIGDVRISTVFLGLDHGCFSDRDPVLWETMIFGGEHDQYQERYTSRKDAEEGHRQAVKLVTDRQKEIDELKRIVETAAEIAVKRFEAEKDKS